MRRLAAVAGIGALGAAGAGILGIARVKGLAVVLGPAGVGVYGQAWSFVFYAGTISALGLGVGATRFVAEARERGDKESLETTLALSLVLPLAAGCIFLVGTIALSPLIGPALLGSEDFLLVALAAVSIPLVAGQTSLQHVIQGFEDVVGQNVAYLIYGGAFTAASIIGALAAGVNGAVAGLAVGNLVLVLLYLARTKTLLRRADISVAWRALLKPTIGPLGKSLLHIGAASLLLAAVFAVCDLVVRSTLLHTSGSTSAGLWFALLQISIQFIGMLAGAVTYYTLPAISRAVARKDGEAVRSVLHDSLRLAILAIVPIILAINALRDTVVHVLFSSSFAGMEGYMPAQLTGDVIRTLGWVLGSALVPLGLTRQWVAIGVGSTFAYGVAGVLLTATWGLGGTVAAYVLLWTLALLATAWVLMRQGAWAPTPRIVIALAVAALGLIGGTISPGPYGAMIVILTTGILGILLIRPAERTRILALIKSPAQS